MNCEIENNDGPGLDNSYAMSTKANLKTTMLVTDDTSSAIQLRVAEQSRCGMMEDVKEFCRTISKLSSQVSVTYASVSF